MIKEQIIFHSGEVRLVGTLTLPDIAKSPFPGIVLLHGGSPLDRDENPDDKLSLEHVRGLKLNVFKDIAEALVEGGISSLRYDKRGVGASEGDFLRRSATNLIDDATKAVKAMREHPHIKSDRVGILGHSEGGMIGPQVIKLDEEIAGFASCASTISNLREILIHQFNQQPEQRGEQAAALGRLLEDVDSGAELVRFGDALESGEWFREWMATDLADALRRVRCPVLLVQGDKDYQVPWREVLKMARVLKDSGNKDVTLALFSNLDHLLKFEPGASSPARYHAEPNRPTEPAVLRTIVAWAQRVLADEPSPPPIAPGQGLIGEIENLESSDISPSQSRDGTSATPT